MRINIGELEKEHVVNIHWYDEMMDIMDRMSSQDILDRGEVVSLDSIKTQSPSYRMEDELIEAEELDDLWDCHEFRTRCVGQKFRLRRVGVC